MVRLFNFSKLLVITIIISSTILSCSAKKKEPKYIVLSNGETPVFLDTELGCGIGASGDAGCGEDANAG